MKKTILRVFCLMLCLLMIVPFAACTVVENDDSTGDNTADTPNDTTTNDGTTDEGTPDEGTPDEGTPDDGTPDDGTTDNNPGNEGEETPEPPVDTREEVDMDTLIEKLTASIYSDNIKTSSFVGLSDPSLIGIKKDTLEEVLYPAPADADCAKVINVADHGITPATEDCSSAFKTMIDSLKGQEGVKKVVFPEGDYKFKQTLRFKDLKDLYICSESPDKRFSITMTTWTRGIEVEDCENIHFNNFDFDYANPSVITGTVASYSANTVVINVDNGYNLAHASYKGAGFTTTRYGSYMEFRLDEATGKYVPNSAGNLLYNSTGDPWNNAITSGTWDSQKNQLTLKFADGRLKKVNEGVKVNVAYTMYEYFGFHATGGEDIYVEGVTFYHTMGMAIGMSAVNNVYLNRFKLTPREGRLMTATADGFHCGSCTGDIVVTNSVFEYSHDDSFNIKGAYGKVIANTPKSVSYDAAKEIPVEVGDVLDFYSATDFKHLGSFTVKKVDTAKSKYDLVESLGTIDLSNAYIANDTQICSLTVKNSFFGNKRNRGMLVQCRDVLIEGCTFQNIIHGPFLIMSNADHFAEGIMPKNVVIKNNKFLHNSSGDINVFTNGPEGAVAKTILGVEISNNFFFESQGTPISFKSTGDSKITDNFIYNFKTNLGQAIYVWISEDVEISGNFIKGEISNPDFEAILIAEDSTKNITSKKNFSEVVKAD